MHPENNTNCPNRNFIKFMHKPQYTRYSQLLIFFFKLSDRTIQDLIQTKKNLIMCIRSQMGSKVRLKYWTKIIINLHI